MALVHDDRHEFPRRVGHPVSDGPAVEDHGRVVTANQPAAAFYRQAQRAVDSTPTVDALRGAVRADPTFGLAVADLEALTHAAPSPIGGHQMKWERHHIEVVRTAAAGNVRRAADLLREHLASVGCDPLALSIVTSLCRRAGYRDGLEGFSGQIAGCHPHSHENQPGDPQF